MKKIIIIAIAILGLVENAKADNYLTGDIYDLTPYCVLQAPSMPGMPNPPQPITYISIPPIDLSDGDYDEADPTAMIAAGSQFGDAGETDLLLFAGPGVGQFNISVDFYPSIACGQIYALYGVVSITVMSPPFFAPNVYTIVPLVGMWPNGNDHFSFCSPMFTVLPGSIVIANIAATGVGSGGRVWATTPFSAQRLIW